MQTIAVKYIDTTSYTVDIWHDDFFQTLSDYTDAYIVKDFRRDYDGQNAIDVICTENGYILPSVQAKIKAGKMFFIDIYEHGNSSFSLSSGTVSNDFDTCHRGGYIELSDFICKGINFEQRQALAKSFLRDYTDLFNGNVYGYTITTANGQEVDSCGGYVGDDSIMLAIYETIPNALNENVTIIGHYDGGGTYDVYFDYNDCIKLNNMEAQQ